MPRRALTLVATTVAACTCFATAVAGGATAVAAAPRAAQAQPASAPSAKAGEETVSLQLTPRDAALLQRTARDSRRLSPVVREHQRRASLAGPGRAAAVADKARALGLSVLQTTDTSVLVSGTPELVRSLFGSARAQHRELPTGQALPQLPAAFAGLVTVAGGGDETRPARRPLNQPDGSLSASDLRGVYAVPSFGTATPAANAPAIATLQFSNWNNSDLGTYVTRRNIYGKAYNPVSAGTFTSVDVKSGTASGVGTDYSGSTEVALDQETLSSIAPQVKQVAYFAPNTPTAQADALNQVAADANSRRLLAVSTSWGNCEPFSYPDFFTNHTDPLLDADQTAILNVIASGVTMFAASGDGGSADCLNQAGNYVDAPASFPYVIGVGGTHVQAPTSGASPGNTTQTGWSGSGGGFSQIFTRPAYQDRALPESPPGSQPRGVPDIAMDGDDKTGLDVYDSRLQSAGGCGGECGPVGGTSLSAPLAAGSFGSALVTRGYTQLGVGDISGLIYGDQGTSSLQDVTSGSNGGFTAGSGWDAVTGLGTPVWSAIAARALMAVSTTSVAPNATSVAVSVARPAANALTQWTALARAATINDCPSYGDGHGTSSPPSAVSVPTSTSVLSILAVDPSNFCHIVTVSNFRSVGDVAGIASQGTQSGRVELHVLSRASGYQAFSRHTATGFGAVAPNEWQFMIAPYTGPGQRDLVGVHYRNTGSGRVEMHVLSQNSNYQGFVVHVATPLAALPSNEWQFALSGLNGDGTTDLFGIHYANTSSHRVEVHVLSRSSGFQGFSVHAATGLAAVAPGTWSFLVGDSGDRGDLVGVKRTGTGSGATEVHTLTAASRYTSFSLHRALPLSQTPQASDQFSLARFDGDSIPDLVLTKLAATGSGRTEVHVLAGSNGFASFLAHVATALGPVDPSAWNVGMER